jgi:hypothetical protein
LNFSIISFERGLMFDHKSNFNPHYLLAFHNIQPGYDIRPRFHPHLKMVGGFIGTFSAKARLRVRISYSTDRAVHLPKGIGELLFVRHKAPESPTECNLVGDEPLDDDIASTKTELFCRLCGRFPESVI